jgi:acyl carrier protein
MNKYIEDLQLIFNTLFQTPPEIHEETDASISEEWDSFMQVQIVLAVEEKYSIRFQLEEIEALKNIGEFIKLIEKYVS